LGNGWPMLATVTDVSSDVASQDPAQLREQIQQGGPAKYHESDAAKGKLFARERIARLTDPGSFTEDGAFANVLGREPAGRRGHHRNGHHRRPAGGPDGQ